MDLGRGHNRDRINNLPDEVLCHILSFLGTKSAVGTSILSRRWRYLWASIPNLDFDETLLLHQWGDYRDDNHQETSPQFINFVNKVLLLSNVSNIQKFNLRLCRNCNPATVHTWICTAIERNVQKLCLNVGYNVNLPHILFTSKTLVFLELSSLIPKLPASVWLPSLKILHLMSVTFYEANSVQELFIGCPILEELVIQREDGGEWNNHWDFNVSSPSLKSLTIEVFVDNISTYEEYRDYECKLMLDAPNLEYLSLSDYGLEDYLVNNLSSLSKAYINVAQTIKGYEGYSDYGDRIYKLLRGISNVKFLSLSDQTLLALFHRGNNTLPTFHNVTHLELFVGHFGWNLLADFLQSSPNLEVLVLGEDNCSLTFIEDYWSPPEQVPNCLVSHLKEIKIGEFSGKEYQLNAIEYLLKNAMVLKKMEIDCRLLYFDEEESSIRKELFSFPRGSSSCQLCLIFWLRQ